jgi:hypothetical protein
MGLYLLIPTFAVILLSVLVVRAGAVALRMTGLDEKTANFQALSAFTRAGFTTRESESVVSHPQRRTIVSWLIILGNAGIVAVIVTGTSSLTSTSDYRLAIAIGILVVGIYIVYRLVKHTGLTKSWENLVENKILRGRIFRRVHVEHLLHLAGGYGVGRVAVIEKSQLAGESVEKLAEDKFVILGMERDGQWVPSPEQSELVRNGDTIVFYGSLNEMDRSFRRKKGDSG